MLVFIKKKMITKKEMFGTCLKVTKQKKNKTDSNQYVYLEKYVCNISQLCGPNK